MLTVTEILKATTKLKKVLSLFSGIPAGFPSPANDYLESSLDLNEYLIQHPAATYFVRVKGTSMINAGIFHDDLLIVDRSLQPKDRSIVVAVLDGEFTLKRLKKHNGKIFLCAENPRYTPIEIKEDAELYIWGVVTSVIHKPQ